MTEQKTEAKKERYSVGQVATQTEDVIVDNKDNKSYTITEFLAKLGNDNEKLKKLLD